MQSLLFALVIVGAAIVFGGNSAKGHPREVYYAIAAGFWILTVVLAQTLL
jgi:hypothetical protein